MTSVILDYRAEFAMKRAASMRRQIARSEAAINDLIAKTRATRERIEAHWAKQDAVEPPCDVEIGEG